MALAFCLQSSGELFSFAMQKKEDFEYWVTEHLRMNGYYWGLTALVHNFAPAAVLAPVRRLYRL
jgi:hypothetical protein